MLESLFPSNDEEGDEDDSGNIQQKKGSKKKAKAGTMETRRHGG